nr:retrotransposon protein, putative, Ty1-copia subclass [Tanacetum cinerariifolium]
MKVENQLGKTIKALRSDRIGKYISQEFKDYLKAYGIVQQLTPPYTPHYNAVSERRNCTLLDMVRSMMNLTTMPLSFWDYALESAACIINIVSTKKVDKTPYELDSLNFLFEKMSRYVLTVGSTIRIPLLYQGEYSQWVERFMSYLEEQTDREAMINSIKNGDQPLPRVTQVSIAGTSSTKQPPLKDKSMCNKTAKDLWDALARHMLGSEYGEQDRKATKCGYSKDKCELNFKFLNNLQLEWKQYATMMRQNKNLMDINIDALYNILKKNQRDVNDAMGSKKKTIMVTSDPLALIAEKTNVSRSKGKVVVSSDSEGSEADDFMSIAETTSTEQPSLKDKSMWSDQEKRIQKIDCLARSLLIQGLPNDIYSLIDSNMTAKDLWDALARHILGSEYGEQDRKAAVLQNKNLMDININALYNILKQNQGDVNDAMRSKKKTVMVTSDPLALIAEKTNVSRSKEKIVVSSDSEGSEADDFSELKKITALLAKAFNRRKSYSKPTNNNLRTSSTSQSANKKQEFVKTDDKQVVKKADEKKRDMSRVKCYNCKKKRHFSKDCKKAKVKDYEYYKTKMLLAKKDKDEQVLLAED